MSQRRFGSEEDLIPLVAPVQELDPVHREGDGFIWKAVRLPLSKRNSEDL